MQKLLISSFTLCLAGSVHAGIPLLNATCPGDISMHADQGGPVYINGNRAKLEKFNENFYEAKGAGVTISISINPDGSAIVAYTGKHGANGVCELQDYSAASSSGNTSGEAAPAAPANTGSKVTTPGNMPAFCRGEASSMFATKPMYISTGKLIHSLAGYVVKGTADLGEYGKKPFQCEFSKSGEFLHFKSLVDEGRL